jgi:hypothetical protein
MIYAAAVKFFDKHLAHVTAVIGIPLAGLGLLQLVLVDLLLVRDKRPRLLLVLSAVVVMMASLAFMVYRFARLKP